MKASQIRVNQRTKIVILAAVILIALLAVYACGILIPAEAVEGDFLSADLAPSFSHLFGTDALGRDLFLRTLKGLALSITIGISASVISAVIAVLVGIAAASGSKRLDVLINWCIDLVMSVPHTILILLISFVLGRGLKGLLVGIAATHWCSLARLIRGEVLQLRSRQYVAVSRKLGKPTGWILQNHLLPHLLPQFIAGLVLLFPHAILHEASISFLGFGLSPEQPAIGVILSESMRYLTTGKWWLALFPGLALVGTVVLFAVMGEHLRRLLDPASLHE